jgi:hypothetical protein
MDHDEQNQAEHWVFPVPRYLHSDEAACIGFKDGFLGTGARSVSDGYDQQTTYFDAYRKGREHRKAVEHVCKAENLTVDEAMRKAFEFYYAAKYASGGPVTSET